MNRDAYFAALIEKNRIALLRMVFCWLSAALCLNVAANKPLPRRVAAYVLDLIVTAEKATGCLLVAVFYLSRIDRRYNPAFEREAKRLMAANGAITLGALTTQGIIQRLKALQHILLNLRVVARRIARSIAARARVGALKLAVFALSQPLAMPRQAPAPKDALPP